MLLNFYLNFSNQPHNLSKYREQEGKRERKSEWMKEREFTRLWVYWKTFQLIKFMIKCVILNISVVDFATAIIIR